jgi:hypothetical protein
MMGKHLDGLVLKFLELLILSKIPFMNYNRGCNHI